MLLQCLDAHWWRFRTLSARLARRCSGYREKLRNGSVLSTNTKRKWQSSESSVTLSMNSY